MANTTGYGYLLGPAPQFFDANGKPLVGGKLFVYIAGTTTTAVTYSDFNRTENTSPVILNDLGTCMLIVPSANLYKIVLYDRNGNLLLTRDNVSVSSEQQIIYTTANKVDSSDSTVDVTATTDPDTGMVTYDLSIQKEIDRAEEAEGALAEDIANETDRATAAEKAAKTEVVAGDNITVTKTVGANGQDVYTIDDEGEDNLVDDVRVNGTSVVTDKVANIDVPVAGTASPRMDGAASAGASGKFAREDHVHPSDTSREAVANKTTVVLGDSDSKYPTDKAVSNFVNSSIATNTAYYISDNGEPFTSVEELEAYPGIVTNNDYAFVTGTDSAGNTYYDRYKATVRGSTVTWALEYRLNNSSFTAAQWAAINSGITAALVGKIHEHSNKAVLDGITATDVSNWNNKLDKDGNGSDVTVGFTQSSTRTNIATGSKLSTLFGKIQKWFADMGALAFKDKVGASDVESGTYPIDISGSAYYWRGAFSGIATSVSANRFVYIGRKRKSIYGCLIGLLTICSHVDSKDTYVVCTGWSNSNFGDNATIQRISSGGNSGSIKVCLYNHEITENGVTYSEIWAYIPTNSGEADVIFRTLFNAYDAITLATGIVNQAGSAFTGTLTKCANSDSRNIAFSPTNTAKGNASVPVYVTASGEIVPCTDDFVHDSDVVSTYSPTGTDPVNGTAIASAIQDSITWMTDAEAVQLWADAWDAAT